MRGEHGQHCRKCAKPVHKNGLCVTHYKRRTRSEYRKRTGDPAPPEGLGVIRCDSCGGLLRDHPLIRPCPLSPLSAPTGMEL